MHIKIMNTNGYLSNTVILEKSYCSLNGVTITLGLWAEIDFQPQMRIKNNLEIIGFISFSEWKFIYKLIISDQKASSLNNSYSNTLYNFFYCDKLCKTEYIFKTIESLKNFVYCINVQFKKLEKKQNNVKKCIDNFKTIISSHKFVCSSNLHSVLVYYSDKNSLIEQELLSLSYEYFMPDVYLSV